MLPYIGSLQSVSVLEAPGLFSKLRRRTGSPVQSSGRVMRCALSTCSILMASATALTAFDHDLKFHPPVVVGEGAGFADNFHAVSDSVYIGSSGAGFLSTDSGASWEPLPKTQSKGMKGVVADTFFRPDATAKIRNLGFPLRGVQACEKACAGRPTPTVDPGSPRSRALHCYTCFQTDSYALYVGAPTPSAGSPVISQSSDTGSPLRTGTKTSVAACTTHR